MKVISVAALALLLGMDAALAQRRDPFEEMRPQNQQFQQQMQQQQKRTQAANRATKAEPVPSSLEQLLTSGWAVVGNSMGPMGTQLVLRSQGDRWILCDLRVVDGLGNLEDQPISRCLALN